MIHLVTAGLFGALAWLLWWQAVPAVKAERGRWRASLPLLLGLAMGCYLSTKLELWQAGAPVSWATAGDAFLCAAAAVELLKARALGRFRWSRCPDEVRSDTSPCENHRQ